MEYDTADSGSEQQEFDVDNVVKVLGKLSSWEDLLFRNVLKNYADGYYKGTLDLLERQVTCQENAYYCGLLKNGLPEDPYGKLTYHDSSRFEGSLKQGKRNGLGMLKTKNNLTVVANWTSDQVDGFCLLKFDDQVVYCSVNKNEICD